MSGMSDNYTNFRDQPLVINKQQKNALWALTQVQFETRRSHEAEGCQRVQGEAGWAGKGPAAEFFITAKINTVSLSKMLMNYNYKALLGYLLD